jgi:hypothetical protein
MGLILLVDYVLEHHLLLRMTFDCEMLGFPGDRLLAEAAPAYLALHKSSTETQ